MERGVCLVGHATKISAQWNKLAWGTRLDVSVKFIARLTSVNTIDRHRYGCDKVKSGDSLEKQNKIKYATLYKRKYFLFN